MAKFVLTDAKVFYGGRDLSGELSSVGFEYTAETPDRTTFGGSARRRLPGVLDVSASHQGFWDSLTAADSVDQDLFDKIGAASDLMSFSPDGGQLTEIAYSFQCQAAEYSPGATHGEVFAFSVSVQGDGPLVRGEVMENGVFTTPVGGTTNNLGAVAAEETIYSTVHVVAASGTTPLLDVTVESDVTDAFIGAETTRMTHPQFGAVGADRQSLVGAVTDAWWRLLLTIAGGSPSFTVFGSLGIQLTTP